MSEHSMRFSAPPGDVTVVHDFLEGVWAEHPHVGEDERMAFELALIELSSNVIRHADPGTGVTCSLTLDVDDDALSARLSDTGETGDILLSEREMPDELAESGRGLALVQRLVDHLGYERSGDFNVWTVRRARAPREA